MLRRRGYQLAEGVAQAWHLSIELVDGDHEQRDDRPLGEHDPEGDGGEGELPSEPRVDGSAWQAQGAGSAALPEHHDALITDQIDSTQSRVMKMRLKRPSWVPMWVLTR